MTARTIRDSYARQAEIAAGDTISIAVSSETPVHRWFGTEVLSHEPGAINMERADARGLPVLVSHDSGSLPIGRLQNFRLDADGKTRGDLRFSERAAASEVESDIRDGIITDVSVGYRIDEYEETDNGIRATRWTPFEVSMVSVPADHTVGVFRSDEGVPPMADETKRADDGTSNVTDFKAVQAQAKREGLTAGRAAALEEVREIREQFAPFLDREDGPALRALMDDCIDQGNTTVEATAKLLDALKGGVKPVQQTSFRQAYQGASEDQQTRQVAVQHGADGFDKWRSGVQESLELRCGLIKQDADKLAGENEFRGASMVDLAREYLGQVGISTRGLSRVQIVGEAFTCRGIASHSTSDFSSLLANVANKALLQAYQETDETWQAWTATGSLPDFKQATRPNLSLFDSLDEVKEGAEYTYGTYGDKHEPIVLATYGKLFSITRQALINDDLGALSRIPAGMGRAAARQVGNLVYAVLTSNPEMTEDGVALFDAAHNNLNPGGAGAPAVASVDAMRVAMALQKDPSGNATLGIRPMWMLVPVELETSAQTLREAIYDPAATAGTLTPNAVQNTFQVISEHRLSSASATKWYMTASPGTFPTVEVAFLDGMQAPYMETQNGWSQDGAQYKVRLDAGVAPLDWRGMATNDGA